MKGEMKGMWMPMVWMFIANLVMAWVLAFVLHLMGSADTMSALKGGFWVWLGFFAAGGAHNYLFPPKSFSLYLIDMAEILLALLLMSWILVRWM